MKKELTGLQAVFPLAEKLRPASLQEFFGQEHLTGAGKIIDSIVRQQALTSLILWGPPGTGKTTLSRILARELGCTSREFSATISKIAEIKQIMAEARHQMSLDSRPLLVFVDEIHHFNKHMQDAFLPYVERGEILLLGTTTENPAYKLNRALLSRMQILELTPLKQQDLEKIMSRAVDFLQNQAAITFSLNDPVRNIIINHCNGDARILLNSLEILARLEEEKRSSLTPEIVTDTLQKSIKGFDRSGDDRYQLISAFHKSVRNSDLDATLYWLYRMLEGGEDRLFILRRMIRIAAEDIGLADPQALRVCLDAREAFDLTGSPEGEIFLTQAAVYLAVAPKSNALYVTEKKMSKIIGRYPLLPVPLHIINPANVLARSKGAGKKYLYAHDFPEKTTLMQTLPQEIRESGFYQPNALGFEKKIIERMAFWKKKKQDLQKKAKKSDNP